MGKPLRLLFVEDSEDDQRLVSREIQRAGYDLTQRRVETADEMRAALNEPWDCIISDFSLPTFSMPQALALLQSTGLDLPFIIVSGTIGEDAAVTALKSGAHDFMPKDRLSRLVPAIERALGEAAVRRERRARERELEAIARLTRALRPVDRLAEMLPIILNQVMDLLGAPSGAVALRDPASGQLEVAHARGDGARLLSEELLDREGQLAQLLGAVDDTPGQASNRDDELLRDLEAFYARQPRPTATVPLLVRRHSMGVLAVARPAPFYPEEVRLLLAVAEISAGSIHRAQLLDQTQRRLERLTALRAIDLAINASLDMRVILDVLLAHVVAQLGVDAAAVLLLNPLTQSLEHAASRGFHSGAIERAAVRLGERDAGRAVLERRLVSVPDLRAESPGGRHGVLAGEGFQAYFAMPLIAKGQVSGVLEVFHRSPLDPDQEWLEFLETLAGQAAIAINNTTLFNNLQRSNAELARAYDATIEGWSRALDLRDHETEGHSQRVTDVTLRLAVALGVAQADLVHVRRGALLHDIGKVGIPDGILLKPGALTDEEWQIMRRHPSYAYELLSPIAYLRPALDIPLYHHEKWDGTGYPHGLAGEQIPLTARLFTVADVWDALRSDRPYRKSWPEDRTRDYLQEQAGRHFDPTVVAMFMALDLSANGRGG